MSEEPESDYIATAPDGSMKLTTIVFDEEDALGPASSPPPRVSRDDSQPRPVRTSRRRQSATLMMGQQASDFSGFHFPSSDETSRIRSLLIRAGGCVLLLAIVVIVIVVATPDAAPPSTDMGGEFPCASPAARHGSPAFNGVPTFQ